MNTTPGFVVPTRFALTSLKQGAKGIQAQLYFYSWPDLGNGNPGTLDDVVLILVSNANISSPLQVYVNQYYVTPLPVPTGFITSYYAPASPYALALPGLGSYPTPSSPLTPIPLNNGLNKVTIVGLDNPPSDVFNLAFMSLLGTSVPTGGPFHASGNFVRLSLPTPPLPPPIPPTPPTPPTPPPPPPYVICTDERVVRKLDKLEEEIKKLRCQLRKC